MGYWDERHKLVECLLWSYPIVTADHVFQVGIRADGRRCFDSRSVVVNAGILPQANGSAKVKLEGGGEDTVVLAAVKAEVGEPHADAPQNGK